MTCRKTTGRISKRLRSSFDTGHQGFVRNRLAAIGALGRPDAATDEETDDLEGTPMISTASLRTCAMALLALGLALLLCPRQVALGADPAEERLGAPLADSLAADSSGVDSLLARLVPLEERPGPRGALLTALARTAGRHWVVGDSGLAAWSRDDSTWQRVATPGRAALNCLAVNGDGQVVCGGDSGRVLLLGPQEARRARLEDARPVFAMAFLGRTGLLGGDQGLLARSADGGASWTPLDAPLPMRFRCVLLEADTWWAGGAGGYLFRSEDRGASWTRLRQPEGRPIVALAESGQAGRPAALDIDGRLSLVDPAGRWTEVGRLDGGEGFSLAAWPAGRPAGWLVGGSGGRLLWLAADGSRRALALPRDSWSTVTALLPTSDGLLLAGSWGLLGSYDPLGEEAPIRFQHDIFGGEERAEDVAATVTATDSTTTTVAQTAVVMADDEGPRRLSNLLETDPRLSTPPTRLRQLLSSYNSARPTGVPGCAVLAIDIDSGGGVERVRLLDEWPTGLGFGQAALDAAAQFTYSPAFADGRMVRSRVIQRLYFEGDLRQGDAWLAGEAPLGGAVDSLIGILPMPASPLSPKRLVGKLGFPRQAKRFFWDGSVTVGYRLHADSEIDSATVLWEGRADHGFGKHALDVLSDLKIAWPAELEKRPNRSLQVIERLNFDRKRYKRAQREMEDGFRFIEPLLAVAVLDSAEYDPGREQLVWLAATFFGEEVVHAWPRLTADLELANDGRVQTCRLTPLEPTPDAELDIEALRGLALLFTWGRTPAGAEGAVHPVRVELDFSRASAAREDAPLGLDRLFEDVSY